MTTPTVPDFARLVVSVLSPHRQVATNVVPVLEEHAGKVIDCIGPLRFDFTSYYEREMGSGIQRWLWVFRDLVDRESLRSIKLLTNGCEQDYTDAQGNRRFNLDPGLLTLENFVLATCKNRAHRIYLGAGVFGDLTLIFRKGSFHPLEWTYPDYAHPEMIAILNSIRESYKCRLRSGNLKPMA